MSARFLHCPAILAACLLVSLAGAARAVPKNAAEADQEQAFEQEVRPILAANCFECHGERKQESGLRLDSRQAVLDGGDSGERAVVPGDPDRSVLIKAVNHVGDYHMPPKRKLAEQQIAALTAWVRGGVYWPANSAPVEKKQSPAELADAHRRAHWAYQPVVRPALPAIVDPAWAESRLDTFVLNRLNAARLSPSSEADRRTLLRRLSYDLIGLPPTMEDVERFAADKSPDAYERQIDRLLASPRFGERFGRHWLDVARYGDTKGYAFAQERRYPYAYTYRDYVIRSLNADLPYDRFVAEQLAADRLTEDSGDQSPLAALGFLTTGRRFNNRNDDIDDQIDVVCRGLLGITVACARCHDHKFDAIPTEDYYSLYGVFASCSEPAELPLLAEPDDTPDSRKFREGLAKLRADVERFTDEKYIEFLDQSRRQSADYLARIAAGDANSLLAKLPYMSLDPKDLRPRLVERWRRYLDEHAKADDPVLGLWHDLLLVPSEAFGEKSAPVLAKWQAKPAGTELGQVNPMVKAAFAADPPQTRMDVPRIYGKLLTAAYDQWYWAGGDDAALAELPASERQLAALLAGQNAPTFVPKSDLRQFLSRADRNKHSELEKKVESYQANSPLAPPRAMVVVDNPKPTEPRVLVRGNPARPGKSVPRQFLFVVAGQQREPFPPNASGRLELAQAIVAPENPLTRRVIVNRLWMHHFGEPLVDSPSDFGIRTPPPTHPELLDDLAAELLDRGWSLKALHRQIVQSASYRQASLDRPDCRAADPENRLLWRMNRRRLEWEAVRDTVLALSGRLDTAMFGRAVELTTAPFARRRAVYGFLDRQDLPNLFRVFDIASPDQSSPRRSRTTVPQQALFLMNSPFVVEQAEAIAHTVDFDVAGAASDEERLAAIYRHVLAREPDSAEQAACLALVTAARANAGASKLSEWAQVAQLLLLANETMYVD